MGTYRDLDVYKKSYKLALDIHILSMKLPQSLQFDLADQIRRSSRSIPSNIAEGFARSKSKKDTINFLKTAVSSADEVLFNLEFMKDTELISSKDFEFLFSEYKFCTKQISSLIKYTDGEKTE